MTARIEDSDVVALAAALVRANTVNPPGHELVAAEILASWLQARGVHVHVQLLSNTRANLVARVPGSGRAPALAFCGHMDTVPIGHAAWPHAPFDGVTVGNRLYGRGAADMKGALAGMAGALAGLAQREIPLERDVLLLATAGEEVDSCGARQLLAQGLLGQIDAIIVGEPTGMSVAVAHKGALWVKAAIAGCSAHGSMPHLGSNAILSAYRFLQAVVVHRFQVQPHPLLGLPTASPNLISGGTSANVVPDCCEVTIDIRSVPGLSHETIIQDMQRLLLQTLSLDEANRSRIDVLLDRAPLDTAPDAMIVQVALETGRQVFGRTPAVVGMSYYTDASVISPSTGIPIIVWGPGDAAQAHQANEYVDTGRLLAACHAYETAAIRYSSGSFPQA